MEDKTPSYISGANFIADEEEIDEALWPRSPEYYTPTRKAQQRFRELGGIITGEDIGSTIRYGEIYPAARSCVAFVSNLGGMALYVIAASDMKGEKKLEVRPSEDKFPNLTQDDLTYCIITIWPYVFNRNQAWSQGRWTGSDLDKVEDIQPAEWW